MSTMLSEPELLQICRCYSIECPVCGTDNGFYRLKRDVCRPAKTEGDGHPLVYKWSRPGFDSVDPKQFFFGVCQRCRFTGELADPDFRQAAKLGDTYRESYDTKALRALVVGSTTGKGVAQALGKILDPKDPLGSVLAQFYLGIYAECLRNRLIHNNVARYYLRVGWIFRDQPRYYAEADLKGVTGQLAALARQWERCVPSNTEQPVQPGIAVTELDALRTSRDYFERTYEMLRESKLEDELRLRQLLAEVGYRIYVLSSSEEDYRKASSFFSGAMQQCLGVISDKKIVGGVVNRAREVLETCGERGRELRELKQKRQKAGGGSKAQGNGKSKKPAPKKSKGQRQAAGKSSVQEQAGKKPLESRKLDEITRQASVLQEEVGELRQRVHTLEEDNKKWRQLAGRDTLTGLPNKNMLVRLVMPRVLSTLQDTGVVSCIAISLDRINEANSAHGWNTGDRMLQESVRSLREFLQDGDELYRLDGVQFGLFGRFGLNEARQRATGIRRALSRARVAVGEAQFPLVASIGVVSVDRMLAQTPGECASKIYAALLDTVFRARSKGGGSLEVCNNTHF